MKTFRICCVLGALVGAVAAVCACSPRDDDDVGKVDAGLDAAPDAPRSDSGFVDLDAGTRPDVGIVIDDAGWATFEGIPNCPLEYPARADALPPPIHWVDCPTSLNLPGACTRIALDFPDPRIQGSVLTTGGAREGASGVEFTLRVVHPTFFEWRGIDASNQVRVAIRSANLNCGPGIDNGPADGRYALGDYVNGGNAAVVAGNFSGLPALFTSYQGNSDWYAQASGIFERNKGLVRHPWDGSAATVLSAQGMDASLDLGQLQEVAAVGALPARIYASSGNPFHIYEYASGTPRKIVVAGRDVVNEVGSFAVSRDRMFWSNVEPIGNTVYHQETAIYTQELDVDGALKGVRQRLPSPSPSGYSQSAKLGCNVLARLYQNATVQPGVSSGGGLEIFDFRTMHHWRFPSPGSAPGRENAFGYQSIQAVTCTEVIAAVKHYELAISNQLQNNFGRFDLSKIGPGEPFTMTPDPVR